MPGRLVPGRGHALAGNLSGISLAILLGVGCASAPSGYRLPAGIDARAVVQPASGLAHGADLARARLTYALAWLDADTLSAAELDVAFALVTRASPRASSKNRSKTSTFKEVARTALGPVEFDIEDIAVYKLAGGLDGRLDGPDGREGPGGPGGRVFVASRDGSVRVFAARSGQVLATWPLGSPATAVAVTGDGAYVAMGTADGVLCLRRYRDGALLHCALAHQGQVSALAVSPDDGQLVSAAWTGEVIRWQLPTLAELERRQFAGAACDLAFAPDGQHLAVARSAFPPRRTSVQVARERQAGPDAPGHPDHAISVWHIPTGRVRDLTGHGGPVTSVAWTPDGARVVSGSWDRTVRLWAIRRQDEGASVGEIARYGRFLSLVRDVAVSPDGRHVAVAAWTDGRDGPATVVLALLYPAVVSGVH